MASIVEAIPMGIVTGYIFFNLGRDQARIRSREGGLYSVAALQGYLILLFEIYRMTIDIPTFDRQSSGNCFFIFLAITILNHYVAVTYAITCVVAMRHFSGASLIEKLAYTIQSISCAMFIQVDTIAVYVQWLKWIAYNFYAFGAYVGSTNSRATSMAAHTQAAPQIQLAYSTAGIVS
ncbi:hypothetical protein E4U42_005835 [Claviceps africana]|uniref:Uncharacterized protein n=1 Tax=Claviceps africana TaxID=83212 RepID=A0A8K0NH39_9HYPO|nr:hypothetical protein E4U42_005835 [Claviceps africana]